MMMLWFGYANTSIAKKYTRKDDLREYLARCRKAQGEEPQPKWVHIFYHTLDMILMKWYLETELRHGTQSGMFQKESFLLTFNFEDEFEYIDGVLQEIKSTIFKILEEPIAWLKPDWSTQLRHALGCYNMTI